jgi:hypothetical protein
MPSTNNLHKESSLLWKGRERAVKRGIALAIAAVVGPIMVGCGALGAVYSVITATMGPRAGARPWIRRPTEAGRRPSCLEIPASSPRPGASSGSAPSDSNFYRPGSIVRVQGNPENLYRFGYCFAGWNTKADGSGANYGQGATFAMGAGAISVTQPSAITVSLNAPSGAAAYGQGFSTTATASEAVDSWQWYLDGIHAAGQTTASFSGGSDVAKGSHSLMAVAYKDSVAYSASACISVQEGKRGMSPKHQLSRIAALSISLSWPSGKGMDEVAASMTLSTGSLLSLDSTITPSGGPYSLYSVSSPNFFSSA